MHIRSLYARLVIVLLTILVPLGGVWLVSALWATQRYREEIDQKLHRDLAKNLVAESPLLEGGVVQRSSLENVFHHLMLVNPRIEVYLLDASGKILAFSAPEGKVKRQRVTLAPIRRFLRGSGHLPVYGDDPRSVDRRKVFSAAPIPADGPPEGYLYVVLGGEEYESVAHMMRASYILQLSTWIVVGAVAVAAVTSLLLFRHLTRRLSRLDQRMRSFAEESAPTDPQAPKGLPPPRDEIDRLEVTFDQMASRIVGHMEELKQLDELRRELVANISHDLRTPITALQGYLETLLLKEEGLTPGERREYVEIALKHGEHLGKLVSELFELAKLDAGETQLETEPFSIAELAQDVVQKYRLPAERQGVALCAVLPEGLPFVTGDLRLLERVLGNLIDNALRHTPAGGQVTVTLAAREQGLEVRVEDDGSGIPPRELPRIFDRFYRGEETRHRPQAGAGLGLAISKRIVELHGASIEVESAVGRGASFFFLLPFATG